MEPNENIASEADAADLPGSSYLPATTDPSQYLEPEGGDSNKEAAERIETLYGRMRPCRRQFDAILDYCREARTLEEIEGNECCAQATGHHVYDVATLCRLLVRAGGLEEHDAPAPEPQVVEVDGVAYLEPAPQDEGSPTRFATTAAGLEHIAAESSLDPFKALLDEEPQYEHVYRILLDACANEGGATARQLEDAVIDDPALQEPRMYASYFYDRLDALGLVAWTGPWTATELGRTAISYLDARS